MVLECIGWEAFEALISDRKKVSSFLNSKKNLPLYTPLKLHYVKRMLSLSYT